MISPSIQLPISVSGWIPYGQLLVRSPKRVLTTSQENSESIPDPKENLRAPGQGSCHRATIDKNRFCGNRSSSTVERGRRPAVAATNCPLPSHEQGRRYICRRG